jgi:hypothetical protein
MIRVCNICVEILGKDDPDEETIIAQLPPRILPFLLISLARYVSAWDITLNLYLLPHSSLGERTSLLFYTPSQKLSVAPPVEMIVDQARVRLHQVPRSVIQRVLGSPSTRSQHLFVMASRMKKRFLWHFQRPSLKTICPPAPTDPVLHRAAAAQAPADQRLIWGNWRCTRAALGAYSTSPSDVPRAFVVETHAAHRTPPSSSPR